MIGASVVAVSSSADEGAGAAAGASAGAGCGSNGKIGSDGLNDHKGLPNGGHEADENAVALVPAAAAASGAAAGAAAAAAIPAVGGNDDARGQVELLSVPFSEALDSLLRGLDLDTESRDALHVTTLTLIIPLAHYPYSHNYPSYALSYF